MRTVVSATRSRRAGVRRRRRGRSTGNGSAGHRRHRYPAATLDPASARRHATTASRVGDGADVGDVGDGRRRRRRRRPRGDRADGDDDRRGAAGAERVDPAVRRPTRWRTRRRRRRRARPTSSGVGRRRDGAVGRHRPRRAWPAATSPSASAGRGPVGLGEQDPGRRRRELGEQALGPGDAPARGRPAARPPRRARRPSPGRRRPGARRDGRRAAARPRRAPLADVTTSQSNAASRASARAQGDAAVGRSAISISGTCTTVAPSVGQPVAELARLGPGDGDPRAGERASSPADGPPWPPAAAARGPRSWSPSSSAERDDVAGDRRAGRRRTARNTCSAPPATWAPTGSEQPEPSSARKLRSTSTAWRVAASSTAPSSSAVAASSARRLDGDAALPDGGHELGRVEPLGDPLGQPEHLQRGDGHHDRPAVGHLRRGGWRCCRAARRTRGRGAPRRAGPAGAPSPVATVAPVGEVGERPPDQRVGGVAPAQEGADHAAPRGRRRRQVLGRVHGDVGAAVEHGLLDLLDEHALAADRRAAARPGGGRRSSRRAPARPSHPVAAAQLRRRRPRPGCGPAGCRGWPGARRRHASASVQVEQVAHGGRVALALRRAGVVAQAHGRAVQELGDDRPGQRLDRVALGVVELGEAAGEAGELARSARPRPARAAGRRAAPPGGP